MVSALAQIAPVQDYFDGFNAVADSVAGLANANNESRGAIFTRREVVDFILDLAGYVTGDDLASKRIMEPAFGKGDFLIPIITRLLHSWQQSGGEIRDAVVDLKDAVCAVEIHRESFLFTQSRVIQTLLDAGVSNADASTLAAAWLHQGDFLLLNLPFKVDFAVGNPPYVRQEAIPCVLLGEYRRRYETIYDRADLYVPFIERSLKMLADKGVLAFICADRWMKNKYGGPLRRLVGSDFHLRACVDIADDAFQSKVNAYPAITIIARESGDVTRVAARPQITAAALATLRRHMDGSDRTHQTIAVREVRHVVRGEEPWILDGDVELALVRRLEAEFPTIEEVGCKVGIGVATGADTAFIGDFNAMDVEDDRKLPLVGTRDIHCGKVQWRGRGVLNPFHPDGSLVDLREYPKFRRYVEQRREQIARRHVAKKSPANWYRTIDRITPELVSQPKLLIPDIKGDAHVVLEGGSFYPHHNLYFITSQEWDLRILQAVLQSGIARLFVSAYSTKMRGGFLRFQAQYLRRIRLPRWDRVSTEYRKKMAASMDNPAALASAVGALYGLSHAELSILRQGNSSNGH